MNLDGLRGIYMGATFLKNVASAVITTMEELGIDVSAEGAAEETE